VWRGGAANEAELLAACHRRAIELADELGDRSVAFPAISTGAYGYPVERAAPVAVAATREALAAHPSVELARFVLRDEQTLRSYEAAAHDG
jgi:O-acetyl-ADP-ribose deacetylase (regulator of RNase III)